MLIYSNSTCILIENFPATVICDSFSRVLQCQYNQFRMLIKWKSKLFVQSYKNIPAQSKRKLFTSDGNIEIFVFRASQSECKQYLNQAFYQT